jgi:hypothetical protein
MGYRNQWLNHAGAVSHHREVVLHAFEKETPTEPVRLLDVGVGNGGSLEVWREVLPEGSSVTGLDIDPRCAELGLPVVVCDVTDQGSVAAALRGEWFDLIIDSTGTMSPWTWPFLRSGGRLILEDYEPDVLMELVRGVALDDSSWLPVEEIMRVSVLPHVAVVEKRTPRVVPYINIMVGNFADVTGEKVLIESGIKRVLVN